MKLKYNLLNRRMIMAKPSASKLKQEEKTEVQVEKIESSVYLEPVFDNVAIGVIHLDGKRSVFKIPFNSVTLETGNATVTEYDSKMEAHGNFKILAGKLIREN